MERIHFITSALIGLCLSTGVVWGDDDSWLKYLGGGSSRDVAAVTNPLYEEECGSCHFAYPPGLLPEASWRKMMTSLDDHFGDNAELSADAQQQLLSYITENAADYSRKRLSAKVMRYVGKREAPARITEVPYIRHEHDEIPVRVLRQQKLRISECPVCHIQAKKGSFDEDEINIPGYGRWDD